MITNTKAKKFRKEATKIASELAALQGAAAQARETHLSLGGTAYSGLSDVADYVQRRKLWQGDQSSRSATVAHQTIESRNEPETAISENVEEEPPTQSSTPANAHKPRKQNRKTKRRPFSQTAAGHVLEEERLLALKLREESEASQADQNVQSKDPSIPEQAMSQLSLGEEGLSAPAAAATDRVPLYKPQGRNWMDDDSDEEV